MRSIRFCWKVNRTSGKYEEKLETAALISPRFSQLWFSPCSLDVSRKSRDCEGAIRGYLFIWWSESQRGLWDGWSVISGSVSGEKPLSEPADYITGQITTHGKPCRKHNFTHRKNTGLGKRFYFFYLVYTIHQQAWTSAHRCARVFLKFSFGFLLWFFFYYLEILKILEILEM